MADALLIAEFTFISVTSFLRYGFVGDRVDAAAYWGATNRWLEGLDPYASTGGLTFAAAPPTLLVLAPFARLPLPWFAGLVLVASLVAAIYLLRRLHLPFWFLLFPPIVEALVVGNVNIVVVALLVAAKPAGDIVATLLKTYAFLPVAFLDRRRSVVLIVAITAVTAPFLPWGTYVARAGDLATMLSTQAAGGRSALVYPLLVPAAVAALFILGRRRSAWLVVPALWPATQFHYGVFALPASTRLMAAILAIPLPGAPAIAVVLGAIDEWRQRERAARDTVAT